MPRLVAITLHAVLDQLEQVAVAGHDHHVDALLAGACSASVAITSSASKPSTFTFV